MVLILKHKFKMGNYCSQSPELPPPYDSSTQTITAINIKEAINKKLNHEVKTAIDKGINNMLKTCIASTYIFLGDIIYKKVFYKLESIKKYQTDGFYIQNIDEYEFNNPWYGEKGVVKISIKGK